MAKVRIPQHLKGAQNYTGTFDRELMLQENAMRKESGRMSI